jgi:hypothetical protein
MEAHSRIILGTNASYPGYLAMLCKCSRRLRDSQLAELDPEYRNPNRRQDRLELSWSYYPRNRWLNKSTQHNHRRPRLKDIATIVLRIHRPREPSARVRDI